MSAPVSSPSSRRAPWKPGRSGSTTSSGRKVGTTRPAQPDCRSRACGSSRSRAPSVVARKAMPNRSKSARGRKSLFGEAGRDLVVDGVGVLGVERLRHAEDLLQRVVEPQLRRRAAEEVRTREPSSRQICRPSVTDRRAVARRHAERLERHALAVEHAQDVVVLGHELGRRARRTGVSSASAAGSQWPWGLTMGSAFVRSYRARAIRRTPGSAGRRRSWWSIDAKLCRAGTPRARYRRPRREGVATVTIVPLRSIL